MKNQSKRKELCEFMFPNGYFKELKGILKLSWPIVKYFFFLLHLFIVNSIFNRIDCYGNFTCTLQYYCCNILRASG